MSVFTEKVGVLSEKVGNLRRKVGMLRANFGIFRQKSTCWNIFCVILLKKVSFLGKKLACWAKKWVSWQKKCVYSVEKVRMLRKKSRYVEQKKWVSWEKNLVRSVKNLSCWVKKVCTLWKKIYIFYQLINFSTKVPKFFFKLLKNIPQHTNFLSQNANFFWKYQLTDYKCNLINFMLLLDLVLKYGLTPL